MPLYTRCLKCGNWKEMSENPTEQDQIATGMMLNRPEPPGNMCTCEKDAETGGSK